MAIENKLQKLEDLEVGNIERIIRNIADNEYDFKKDNEKIEEKVNKDFAEYSDIIRKKLPKIINNISLMAEIILKLDKEGQYDSYKINKDKRDYFEISSKQIEKKDKRIFSKKQRYTVPKIKIHYYGKFKYSISLNIFFDEKNIINYLEFDNDEYSSPHNFICAGEDSIDFTESYLDLIERNEYEDYLKGIYLLPQVLNQVPDAIARAYKKSLKKTINQKKKICPQLEDNKKIINDLKVSDF